MCSIAITAGVRMVKQSRKSRLRRQKAMDKSDEDDGYLWVQNEVAEHPVKNYTQVSYINSYRLQGRNTGEFLDLQGIESNDSYVCVTDPMKNSLSVFHKSIFQMIPHGEEYGRCSGNSIKALKELYFSSIFDVTIHEGCDVMLATDYLNKCIHCVPIADRGKNTLFNTKISLPKSDTLTGICVTNAGLIGVLDGEKGEVILCDGHGNIMHTFGGDGVKDGELCLPQFICWDPLNERFIVSDTANSRIQLFTADGRYLFSFGERISKTPKSNPISLKYPSGVTTDDHGRIFLVDQGLHSVLVFDKDGHFLHQIGEPGSSPGCFNSPKSVTLFDDGDMVVTDSLNYRLQHFG